MLCINFLEARFPVYPTGEKLVWKSTLEKAADLKGEVVDFGSDNCLHLLFDGESPVALFKIDEKTALEREILGYEVDALLGLGMTPPTAWFNWQGMEGRLQQFIPNSTTGLEAFIDPVLTEALTRIPARTIQLATISGFIKGIGAGHYSNYLLTWNNQDFERIIEIDLEKIFLKQNRTPNGSPMCRMWILGLPAADLPFDINLLSEVTHSSFRNKLFAFNFDEEVFVALEERLNKIAAFLESGGGTPRELFFFLFGGKELFQKADDLGYPKVIIFNEILKYKELKNLEPFDPSKFFLQKKNREQIIKNIIKYGL